MDLRHKAIIVLGLYLISIAVLLAYFSSMLGEVLPHLGWLLHLGIALFATLLISMILTGNGINIQDTKIAIVLFLLYEIFGLFTSQSITLSGTLVTNAPLWVMSLDSVIGWTLISCNMPNIMINFFGYQMSIIYILTYMVSPIILITILILFLEKSDLKKILLRM